MGDADHHRLVIAASAAIVTLLAILAFVAAMAQALEWSGWWVVAVLITLAALTLLWKVWTDLLKPWSDAQAAAKVEARHANALRVSFSHSESGASVWIKNQDSHEVRWIMIAALPEGGRQDPGLLGPPFTSIGAADGVAVTEMPGGDLVAEVEHLIPDKGCCIGSYAEPASSVCRFELEVSWIDPTGRRRWLNGVGDLCDPQAEVDLSPAEGSIGIMPLMPGESGTIHIEPG
jgi:hypothetical protein